MDFALRAESPLRIGAGRGAGAIEFVTIWKDGERVPFIPGSSLKGTLRSTCELIAKSSGLFSCMAGDCASSRKLDGEGLDKIIERAQKQGNLDLLVRALDAFCINCKIFGSAGFKSHVDVLDAYPNKDTVRTATRQAIAINRRSGSARRGALFEISYIEPGAVFKAGIVMQNLPNYAVGLIARSLELIDDGFVRLGGLKSKGFGRIRLESIALSGIVYKDGRSLRLDEAKELDALDKGDGKVEYVADPASMIARFKQRWSDYVAQSAVG